MFRRTGSPNGSIVLLIDGESNSFAPTFVAGLAAAGMNVHVLSADPHSIVRYSRFCARFHPHDGRDVIAEIRKIADAGHLAAIMACSDEGIRTLAEHRSTLEQIAPVMGTPSVELLDMARDKASLADYLAGAKLPSPPTLVIRGGVFDRAALPLFPALLKPAHGMAGKGIRYLERAWELERIAADPAFSRTAWVLQSFIPGTDVDVSMVCRDGRILAHTEQVAFAPQTRAFTPNYSIRIMHDNAAFETAREVVRAMRWTGFMHMDLRRDARDGRVLIIEINGRFWATAYGSIAAGVNFAELSVRDAQGESFPPPAYADRKWVQLSLARRIGWADIGWRDLQMIRHLKDPGPLLACRILGKRQEDVREEEFAGKPQAARA